MAEYNLLPKLVGHLDRHLIFPLLDFEAGQVAEDDDAKALEFTKAKYELLKTTNMIDFIGNLKAELEGLEEAPAEFNEKRQTVLSRLEQYEEETSKITDLLGREDVVTNLRTDKAANLEFLKNDHGVGYSLYSNISRLGAHMCFGILGYHGPR